MKRFLLLLLYVSVSCFSFAQSADSAAGSAADHDKAFLTNYYQETFDNLKKSVEGLSKEQLQFKASPEKWSVSQCLEHIIKTEQLIFKLTRETLAKPENPEKRKDIKVTDDAVIGGITNREHKATAPKELIGTGTYSDPGAALADMAAQRKTILDVMDKQSLETLRNHVSESPIGSVDGYQNFLFIAGHTARHTLQIEEIKAAENFPGK